MRVHTVPLIIARQRRPQRLVPRRAPVPPARFVPQARQCAPITGGASAPVGAPALTFEERIPRSSSRTSVVVSRLSLPSENPRALSASLFAFPSSLCRNPTRQKRPRPYYRAKFTVRATPASIAQSPLKSFQPRSPPTRSSRSDSIARPGRSPRSIIHTFARSMTSGKFRIPNPEPIRFLGRRIQRRAHHGGSELESGNQTVSLAAGSRLGPHEILARHCKGQIVD